MVWALDEGDFRDVESASHQLQQSNSIAGLGCRAEMA